MNFLLCLHFNSSWIAFWFVTKEPKSLKDFSFHRNCYLFRYAHLQRGLHNYNLNDHSISCRDCRGGLQYFERVPGPPFHEFKHSQVWMNAMTTSCKHKQVKWSCAIPQFRAFYIFYILHVLDSTHSALTLKLSSKTIRTFWIQTLASHTVPLPHRHKSSVVRCFYLFTEFLII